MAQLVNVPVGLQVLALAGHQYNWDYSPLTSSTAIPLMWGFQCCGRDHEGLVCG